MQGAFTVTCFFSQHPETLFFAPGSGSLEVEAGLLVVLYLEVYNLSQLYMHGVIFNPL